MPIQYPFKTGVNLSHMIGTNKFAEGVPYSYSPAMKPTRIGYARCSTNKQDLSAQRQALIELGVSEDRIYTDHGLTGANRARPGLNQAIAALREGDTLVVSKLDRLARFVPDARAITDELEKKGVKLTLGASVHDPANPKGKLRGKQPKLSEKQQKELWRMHDTGEYSISDLAELFTVSRPTVYRTLNKRPASSSLRAWRGILH